MHQFGVIGLQVVLLGGIGVQVIQLQRWQGLVFYGGSRLGGAPAPGTGAEGEFLFAAADGERAVNRVVDGEQSLHGLRLVKQGREERKRILGGVGRDGFTLAEHIGERGEEIRRAYGLAGGGTDCNIVWPSD